jgi:hypothetical protein
VGKLFNFPLRLAVKRDEEWDCASKSGGFVSIFPTGDMTPDFSHSLGRFEPFASCRITHWHAPSLSITASGKVAIFPPS